MEPLVRTVTTFVSAAVLIASSGCSDLTWPSLVHSQSGVPRHARVARVPLIEQDAHHCGPSSLRMVLEWSGVTTDREKIEEETMSPALEGTLPPSLIAAARRNGRLAYVLEPGMDTILREVAAGRPVIVLQNRGLPLFPVWHYSVVVGYDLDTAEVLLHDGGAEVDRFDLTPFENSYLRGGSWALVVLPPDSVPRTAERVPFIKAAKAFEEMGRSDDAMRAYRAALERWPADRTISIALANLLVGEKPSDAAALLKGALELSPDDQALLNNCADALLRTGALAEAEEMAIRATNVDGPFTASAERTLSEIRARRRAGDRSRSAAQKMRGTTKTRTGGTKAR